MAKRIAMLPIYCDAKINIIPVNVKIELIIVSVFGLKFKFKNIEYPPSLRLIIAFVVIVSNILLVINYFLVYIYYILRLFGGK